MNETEKEIDEMAEVIGDTWLVDLEGDTMSVCEVLDEVDIKGIARELIQAGYRNCKDKVVLDKEEYAELKQAKTLLELREETIKYLEEANIRYNKALELKVNKKERQEMAREIFEFANNTMKWDEEQFLPCLAHFIKEKCGVEVE